MIIPPRIGLVVLAILVFLLTQQHPTAAFASGWVLPVKPPVQLEGIYRAPVTKYAAGHRGIDYRVKEGQQLLAPFDGEVYFLGQVARKPVITLIHSGGYLTSYEPACSTLGKGEAVKQKQVFASVCSSGYQSHCRVLCLHYGMRLGENYLSPLSLAGALPPSHTIS